MNKVRATITTIASADKVTLVGFGVGEQQLEMISLGLSEQLGEGSKVTVGVKATSIALSKQRLNETSISNQVEVTITALEMGSLLCCVAFRFEDVVWESVITNTSAREMQLSVGDTIIALIKSSDLSIVEVL